MTFDPIGHCIKLPRRVKDEKTGKWETRLEDYLEVKWRLRWFRLEHPHGVVHTEERYVDPESGYARFKAAVSDGEGGSATGHGTETKARFEDYCERAETRALGRALAALGYGTQYAGEDLSEGEHVVDGPVETKAPPTAPTTATPPASAAKSAAVVKPLDKMNHEEAYIACLTELTRLAGSNTPERSEYMRGAFGAAIDHETKLYQLRKTDLQNGLKRLMAYQKEEPPAVPSMASSASEGNGAAGASDADVPDFRPPVSSPVVALPEQPLVVDGHISTSDVRILELYGAHKGQMAFVGEMFQLCQRLPSGHVGVTPVMWEYIVNGIEKRAKEVSA